MSAALVEAAVALARTGDATLLDAGFGPCADGETQPARCAWMQYKADCAPEAQPASAGACCGPANGYCGTPYLGVARSDLTQPYVKEVLGCAIAAGVDPAGAALLFGPALGLAAFVLWSRRRRGRPGARTGFPLALVLGLAIPTGPVAAQEELTYRPRAFFAGVEGAVSLLSDAPERSFIDATMGYALRGGYRFDRWGVLGQIERNYWVPTELSHAVVPGALNVGAGAEWFLVNGRVRLSATAGPSILWYDTSFDSKGSVGLFADLRPVGLRWRPSRRFGVALDPLSLAIVAPVLGSPGIVQLEYRTILGVELLP